MAKRIKGIENKHDENKINDYQLFLEKSYKNYIRNDFLRIFKSLYCSYGMNVQLFDKLLATECNHSNTKINVRQYLIILYVKNIIMWLDTIMNYNNDDQTSSILEQNILKTSCIQIGQQKPELCLFYKLPDFNTDSDERNKELTSFTCTEKYICSNNKNIDLSKNAETSIETSYNTSTSKNVKLSSENIDISDNLKVNITHSQKKEVDNNICEMTSTLPNTPSPKSDFYRSLTHSSETDVNEIFVNLEDCTSCTDTIVPEIPKSYFEEIDLDNNCTNKDEENLSTSNSFVCSINGNNNNAKKITTDVIKDHITVDKEKLNPIQINSDNICSENISNMSLETSSTIVGYYSSSLEKQSKIKKTLKSTSNGKRFNSVKDIEHISKKKKLEKSSHKRGLQITKSYDMDTSDKLNNTTLSLNDTNNTEEQETYNISNYKENKNNHNSYALNNSTNTSNNLNKDEIIVKQLNCLSNEKKNVKKKNKNNVVVTSSNSTKKISKDMYSRNSKGETKLHAACAKKNLNLVISLLRNGFNPNVKDNAGWTPMHEAVKTGCSDIVKELIFYGAYLNVPGFEYESPLHTAIRYSQFDIATILLQFGADPKFINIYGDNALCEVVDKWPELLKTKNVSNSSSEVKHIYKPDQIFVFLNNVSLNNAIVIQFCDQFNIKFVQNTVVEKKFSQITHIVVPETIENSCDVNFVCLMGIANGLFIITQNWILDSLKQKKLMNCENYEVSGTTSFIDCNGPTLSRISKQKLYPKLFDGINIHICGSIGWEQFSLEQLKQLAHEFGAKLLKRMPNPEDCPNNIIPYHCHKNKLMYHVSNIILYTSDSNRLIKYNMKHLKAFHISWFMEAIQKFIIM